MGLTTKQKTEDVMLFSRQWLNYEKNQFFVLVKKKKSYMWLEVRPACDVG